MHKVCRGLGHAAEEGPLRASRSLKGPTAPSRLLANFAILSPRVDRSPGSGAPCFRRPVARDSRRMQPWCSGTVPSVWRLRRNADDAWSRHTGWVCRGERSGRRPTLLRGRSGPRAHRCAALRQPDAANRFTDWCLASLDKCERRSTPDGKPCHTAAAWDASTAPRDQCDCLLATTWSEQSRNSRAGRTRRHPRRQPPHRTAVRWCSGSWSPGPGHARAATDRDRRMDRTQTRTGAGQSPRGGRRRFGMADSRCHAGATSGLTSSPGRSFSCSWKCVSTPS